MNIFDDSRANRTPLPSPIEVWLSRGQTEITCTVVREDESTSTHEVTARSMRGAQAEMTGYFIAHGYTPAGDWEIEAESDDGGGRTAVEASRAFKLSVIQFERAPAAAEEADS